MGLAATFVFAYTMSAIIAKWINTKRVERPKEQGVNPYFIVQPVREENSRTILHSDVEGSFKTMWTTRASRERKRR